MPPVRQRRSAASNKERASYWAPAATDEQQPYSLDIEDEPDEPVEDHFAGVLPEEDADPTTAHNASVIIEALAAATAPRAPRRPASLRHRGPAADGSVARSADMGALTTSPCKTAGPFHFVPKATVGFTI